MCHLVNDATNIQSVELRWNYTDLWKGKKTAMIYYVDMTMKINLFCNVSSNHTQTFIKEIISGNMPYQSKQLDAKQMLVLLELLCISNGNHWHIFHTGKMILSEANNSLKTSNFWNYSVFITW